MSFFQAVRCGLACSFLLATHSLSATPARADDFIQWQQSSISLLSGKGFTVVGDGISAVTLEHANTWKYGDFFGFLDVIKFHDGAGGTGWYGEVNPRFSLKKMGLISLPDDSIFQDLFIATTFERGKNEVESLLLGLGAKVKVPGFLFFNINAMARKNTSRGTGFDDFQVTMAWGKKFKIGQEDFRFDGFMDFVAGWGPRATNFHFTPQVKWDFGKLVGAKKGKFYVGTEIDIWTNKFGIKNSDAFKTNQIAASAMVQMFF